MILKIINTILKYSIGKELVRGNRSTVTGRYTKLCGGVTTKRQTTKTTHTVRVHDYINGDYSFTL